MKVVKLGHMLTFDFSCFVHFSVSSIYDFARIRMYIWHFDLGDKVVNEYYNLMNYTEEEKKLATLYWLSRVIEYLAYYSEELNEFNTGRIDLHQDFLRNFDWQTLI